MLARVADRLHRELSRVSCRVESNLRAIKTSSELLEDYLREVALATTSDLPAEALILHASRLVPVVTMMAKHAEALHSELEKARSSYAEVSRVLADRLREVAARLDYEVRDCMAKYLENKNAEELRACVRGVIEKLRCELDKIVDEVCEKLEKLKV